MDEGVHMDFRHLVCLQADHVGVVVGAAVSIVGVSDRARPPSWAAPISRPSFAQEHEARKMRRLQSETGPLYAQNLDAEQCER